MVYTIPCADDEAAKVKKDAATAKERDDLERRFQTIEHELGAVTHALKETTQSMQQMRKEQAALNPKKGRI
jgi:septal ring factor EnvC (AmiA/AmiB activator)